MWRYNIYSWILTFKCRYIECTSSSIQALVLFTKLFPGHREKEIDNFITKAVKYLEDNQMPDGSWYIFNNNVVVLISKMLEKFKIVNLN